MKVDMWEVGTREDDVSDGNVWRICCDDPGGKSKKKEEENKEATHSNLSSDVSRARLHRSFQSTVAVVSSGTYMHTHQRLNKFHIYHDYFIVLTDP